MVCYEDMKLPSKTLERKLFAEGYEEVIGVDEVGMACLAGPVYVCAVSFEKDFFERRHPKLMGVRDSKMLSAHQREKFFDALMTEQGIQYQIACSDVATIDRLNIYHAARLAMKNAIEALQPSQSSMVLMDGRGKIDDLSIPQQAIVKGDQKVFTIACASIIAKVTRDRLMVELAKDYPGYGLEQHKGYPTKVHQLALAKFGSTPIHRKSFRLEY